MNYKIVPLGSEHIDTVVDVHLRAFPEFFLTFLGASFLKVFYSSFTSDPQGVGFVAVDTNTHKVIGVIVGPFMPEGYFKRLLKKKWWAFCLSSIKAVIRRPTIIPRLFRAVFYQGETPTGPQRSLLSSIAVSPDIQSKGVGQDLVNKWVDEVKNRGSVGCYLTTDSKNNDPVNAFYQKLGWQIESTYTTPEGRFMNRYILDFLDPIGENEK